MPTSTSGRGRPSYARRTGESHGLQYRNQFRFYERVGLMPDPPRTEGGHRIYSNDHLKRLTFICRSRELGFSLDEVRGLLNMVDGGNDVCSEVKAVTLDHVNDIRRKIADLKRMERVLTEMAKGCDTGEVPECPIVDALFSAGGQVVDAMSPRLVWGRCGRPRSDDPSIAILQT